MLAQARLGVPKIDIRITETDAGWFGVIHEERRSAWWRFWRKNDWERIWRSPMFPTLADVNALLMKVDSQRRGESRQVRRARGRYVAGAKVRI